ARQKTLQVEPQMTLGRRLASPMLGPVHTVGHQLQRGRIHQVDHPLEAEGKPATPATSKTRTEILQVLQSLPKQLLCHDRVTLPIGIGKRVALGRSSPTNRREGSRVQRQSIANVVESQTMGQLREEQREHVTPGGVGARLLLDARLSGQLRDQVIGNVVANLTQNRQLTSRWLSALVFLFHDRACRTVPAESQRFLSSNTTHAVGRLWMRSVSAGPNRSAQLPMESVL